MTEVWFKCKASISEFKTLFSIHKCSFGPTNPSFFILKLNVLIFHHNYNCHNIYWDPLIWLVKNGHLIALTCISFFNEPGPYSWGAGPFTTELLLWYCAMLLWREMDSLQLLTLYFALTPIFSGRKAKINLHTTPKLTVVIPISCLLPLVQALISVQALVSDLAQLTCQKRFDCRSAILGSSAILLGTSYS